MSYMTDKRQRIIMEVTGARGESFADVARRLGTWGAQPGDSDAQVLDRLIEYYSSISGEYYPSVAAGEAATTEGEAFAVAPGDGTVTWYRRTAGGSDEIFQSDFGLRADLAAPNGESRIGRWSVDDLLADTRLSYDNTPAGAIITAGGFRYQVADATAPDAHVTTAGGVKLYVLPAPIPNADAFGADIEKAIETKTGITNALTVPIGQHTLAAGAGITAYSFIHGFGDMSQIVVPPGQPGIVYLSHAGVFDDHPHNVLRDLRITGDGDFAAYPNPQNGTTTGVNFATAAFQGSLGNVEGTVLERHNIGRHIKQSFGHTGRRNYYRANKIGLLLDQVTSFSEYDIYARYNSEAAVRIIGGQNVSFIGGAIEGNPGRALQYIDDGVTTWGQINLTDLYFESNGDRQDGVWSIDIPRTAKLMVNITGGSYWYNIASGIESGPYNLGPSVSMDGVTLNGSFYADEVVGFRNCRGEGLGVWNSFGNEALARLYGLRPPALFHEFKPARYDRTFADTSQSGLVLRTKLAGRGGALVPLSPNDINPDYPYDLSASAGASGSENAGLDYGDGSFYRVQFDTSNGEFNTNIVTLATFSDTARPFRVACFLARPEQTCEIGITMSGGGQAVNQYFTLLANETYRIVVAAQRPMSGTASLRVFPINAAGPAINFLPIWQSAHSRYFEQNHIIGLLVDGVL